MKAFATHTFETKMEFVGTKPKVIVSRRAYNMMWHLVRIASKEVGWLGTVRRVGTDLLIDDVFLFEQEVSAGTCILTVDGLAEVAQVLPTEALNRLRLWGHSHVNGWTSPSGQDDLQMRAFEGSEFFIRVIANKQGRLEFTVYLFDLGLKIHDAEWCIQDLIDDSMAEEVQEAFDAKVSELVVVPRGGWSPGKKWDMKSQSWVDKEEQKWDDTHEWDEEGLYWRKK